MKDNGSWASVEDYLPAGNALWYNWNWQYRHTGGELLMMTANGEPSGYYPTDSSGLSVGTAPPGACVCVIYLQSVCAPIVDGSCGGRCEETPPKLPLEPTPSPIPSPIPPDDRLILPAGVGPWNIIGCTPQQTAMIRKHLDDVCRFRVGGNTPLRRCLQNMCRNGFTIRCGSGAECKNRCGYARVPGLVHTLLSDAYCPIVHPHRHTTTPYSAHITIVLPR